MSTMQSDPMATIKPDIFFTLPPELRDMIYDLVYGDIRRVTMKCSRSTWERSEERRKGREREDFVPGPEYPVCDVSHLLVNKQYFAESCHIWYRSKTFCFLSSRDVACFANSEDPIQRYLFGSVAQLELLDTCLYSIALDELHSVPKLRSLVVRIPAYNIEGMFPGKKIPWLDAFSDIELAASYYVQQLLAIRGLRTIEFRWGDSNEFKKPQHHVKWAAFKAQLETLVRDVVTQPREKEKSIRTMTLDEALKAKKSEVANKWQTPVAKAPPSETPPLSKTDIPTSEAEMLRLCLSRPAALFNWIRDVADNGVNS